MRQGFYEISRQQARRRSSPWVIARLEDAGTVPNASSRQVQVLNEQRIWLRFHKTVSVLRTVENICMNVVQHVCLDFYDKRVIRNSTPESKFIKMDVRSIEHQFNVQTLTRCGFGVHGFGARGRAFFFFFLFVFFLV
jgi:hypothetical protein